MAHLPVPHNTYEWGAPSAAQGQAPVCPGLAAAVLTIIAELFNARIPAAVQVSPAASRPSSLPKCALAPCTSARCRLRRRCFALLGGLAACDRRRR